MRSAVVIVMCVAVGGCASTRVHDSHEADAGRPELAATAHGVAQLNQMLHDRPAMALHVSPGDRIWRWAVSAFAGRLTGFAVHWDPSEPSADYESFSGGPSAEGPASIQIRGGKSSTFEACWVCFVFEMNNLVNDAAYEDILESALSGRLSREEWIRINTQLEFVALMRTREFFRTTWQPWCAAKGITATPRLWYIGAGDTYESWISRYRDPDGYLEYWGRCYDEEIVPYLEQSGIRH